jgi:hypothetical protein
VFIESMGVSAKHASVSVAVDFLDSCFSLGVIDFLINLSRINGFDFEISLAFTTNTIKTGKDS